VILGFKIAQRDGAVGAFDEKHGGGAGRVEEGAHPTRLCVGQIGKVARHGDGSRGINGNIRFSEGGDKLLLYAVVRGSYVAAQGGNRLVQQAAHLPGERGRLGCANIATEQGMPREIVRQQIILIHNAPRERALARKVDADLGAERASSHKDGAAPVGRAAAGDRRREGAVKRKMNLRWVDGERLAARSLCANGGDIGFLGADPAFVLIQNAQRNADIAGNIVGNEGTKVGRGAVAGCNRESDDDGKARCKAAHVFALKPGPGFEPRLEVVEEVDSATLHLIGECR